DRVSAFDVVLGEAIPHKGRVLTQLSAHWFQRLSRITPSHFLSADFDAIAVEVPALAAHREQVDGRAMLVRRTAPVAFACVVSGNAENVPYRRMQDKLGADLANALRDVSMAIYAAGRLAAAERGLLIADTKFEFGIDANGTPILIDEVLTPDSSRFWPQDGY